MSLPSQLMCARSAPTAGVHQTGAPSASMIKTIPDVTVTMKPRACAAASMIVVVTTGTLAERSRSSACSPGWCRCPHRSWPRSGRRRRCSLSCRAARSGSPAVSGRPAPSASDRWTRGRTEPARRSMPVRLVVNVTMPTVGIARRERGGGGDCATVLAPGRAAVAPRTAAGRAAVAPPSALPRGARRPRRASGCGRATRPLPRSRSPRRRSTRPCQRSRHRPSRRRSRRLCPRPPFPTSSRHRLRAWRCGGPAASGQRKQTDHHSDLRGGVQKRFVPSLPVKWRGTRLAAHLCRYYFAQPDRLVVDG